MQIYLLKRLNKLNMNIHNFLLVEFKKVLERLNAPSNIEVIFEEPANPDHGDISTNIAMKLARPLKKSPTMIANEIIGALEYDSSLIDEVNMAGAGFINIKLSNKYFMHAFDEIVEYDCNYGQTHTGDGKFINVEYVSVNPTGLLHLGHGRNAAIGDSISNLYKWTGWNVVREYYFNNAGYQMQALAKSIYARYMQLLGNKDFPFPEDGYHGDYILDIAKEVIDKSGDKHSKGTEDDISSCRKYGEIWCFERIKATLLRMNIHQDVFYNEDTLYNEGKIKLLLDQIEEKGLSYKKGGATWLSLSQLGLKDDRVIVKSTGEPTYRLPDIAYHREKFLRGFDLMVDILGADHIATYPDVLATMDALGYDSSKVKVIIHQFVTLTDNGEIVKMSKRSGKLYTLDELLDEVGADVVRFFLLMRGISTHLEFDLGLAREQSDKNPVFYLQYAHARICSILDNIKEKGYIIEEEYDSNMLKEKQEIDLIKVLIKFPEIIERAAKKFEPQILAEYLRTLAAAFHIFYHECRIIGSDNSILQARLKLALMTKYTLANGLKILGISVPEKM